MKISGGNILLSGEITVPGDKSISHRAVMISALCEGKTKVNNFLMGEDCLNTIKCFEEMGVKIDVSDDEVVVNGVGLYGLEPPKNTLYVGNSGTTIRLISGILSAQNFECSITGDDSIKKRPMNRIINPLREMGANVNGLGGNYPPLIFKRSEKLNTIKYDMPIASAQVKSCILFAGLYCDEKIEIIEHSYSRDHTERMLEYFGADIKVDDKRIMLNPSSKLIAKDIIVPGDISSASFFIVLGLITKNSRLIIKDVGINTKRKGIIEILKKMNGKIVVKNIRVINNEEVADIFVESSELIGTEIKGDIIPTLIDEIPILAVAASFAEGKTVIKDALELKYKESNRIKSIVQELSKMNVDIKELEDGMEIHGPNVLKPTKINTYNDHRIAMSMAIAALMCEGESELSEIESIKTSFPNFFDILNSYRKHY